MRAILILTALVAAGCTRPGGAPTVDMLAPADLQTSGDLLTPADLLTPTDLAQPPILTQSIWIGSGGSASSGAQQLNLRIGGTNTTGTTSAPSGATFTAGSFAQQIN
jgi:hypothetical protein